MSAPVSSAAVALALNRIPSHESAGTSFDSIASPVSQSMNPIYSSDGDPAPPLPPRKCPAKPESATGSEFEVPRMVAPPIPKHQASPLENLASEMKLTNLEADDDGVIVGPAETITGLIDTRPIEARKPITAGNNLYQLKTSPLYHTRHSSFTMQLQNGAQSIAKSTTTPQLAPDSTLDNAGHSEDAATGLDPAGEAAMPGNRGRRTIQQLYMNLSPSGECISAPYENISLEYIERLVSEGYSKENAITALGVSRNNIEMACDILHEFVGKARACE